MFWLQKSLNNQIKSSLIVLQHFLMKRPMKPSGPGAWLFSRFLITPSISSWLKSASKPFRLCSKSILLRLYDIPVNSETPNLYLKAVHRRLAFCSWSITIVPSVLERETMKFLLWDIVAIVWKKWVFSSHTISLLPASSFGLQQSG